MYYSLNCLIIFILKNVEKILLNCSDDVHQSAPYKRIFCDHLCHSLITSINFTQGNEYIFRGINEIIYRKCFVLLALWCSRHGVHVKC